MVIIWQPASASSRVADFGAGFTASRFAKVPGDPPTPFNTTDSYTTVTGTLDGVNTVFNLSLTPVSTLQLYRNGAELTPGASNDYTRAGAVVTFNAGAVPQPGDVLLGIALLSTTYATLAGAINGVNPTFTLLSTPNFLALYRNGILQNPGIGGPGDYVLSGTTITFNLASIPQTGDILLAKTQP